MTALKTIGATVAVGSVVLLATGHSPQRILGFWVTVAVVIGAVHWLSRGRGWVR